MAVVENLHAFCLGLRYAQNWIIWCEEIYRLERI